MRQRDAAGSVKATLTRQLKPLVAFCAGAIVVLAIGVAIAADTLMSSYQQLENSATSQKAEQVYQAFEADLRQLQISNRDYAEWDDAEQFVRDLDPGFVTTNFRAVTMLSMHVDLLWIVDAEGRDLHSILADRATTTATIPAPRELLAALRPYGAADNTMIDRPPADRIVKTPRGLTAFSATEITRSDGTAKTGAVMMFARFIESDEIARVRDTSQLPVAMTTLANGAELPRPVARWTADSRDRATFVNPIDSGQTVGYALLRDTSGEPVAVFSTEQPRDIRALGARTTWYLLSSVVLLFLAFGATALGLVLRLVTLQKRAFDDQRRAEEQQRANRRTIAKQAQRDSLTGLANRLFVLTRLPRVLTKTADSHRRLALIYIDLDFFKHINDSRGHACGDHVLRIVAKRLRMTVSSHDLVARMGGDEFVIVSALMPDIETIGRIAERVQSAIAAELVVDGAPVSLTASLGVAVYPDDGADAEALLKRAAIALNQAKEAGRRCHRFFAADMDARVTEQAVLQQALRKAIGTPQIYMDYQPIIDLSNGRVVSLEALARWRHPELGQIPPMQFIPAAEKSGLIVEMGEHALREVLAQQRAWIDADVPVVPVAVNVSALQVERVDFAALVKRLTAEVGVLPQWVRFEVTESAMMKEPEKLIGTLKALRALGSQVLIDDFGTGFSSLSYLDKLPIDILKIDRAFVRDLDLGSESPVIHAIIQMARRLGLKIVAEGVENAAQAAMLAAWGCDYAQGYFYSKPVSAHHCRSLLEYLRRERPLTDSTVLRVVGD